MKNKKRLIIIVLGVIVIGLIVGISIYGISKYNEKEKVEKTNEELADIFKNEAITPEDDIYSKQKEVDEKIADALKDKNYTLDNPFVLENPYYISPLTAIVVFTTKDSNSVTLEVNGKSYEFESTKNHAIPVYGLIAGQNNTIKITCDGKSKSIDLDMSDIEDDLNLNITTGQGVDLGSDIYVVNTPSDNGMFGFNTNGELVWRLTQNFSLAITELDNGHLLLADSNYIIGFSRKGLVEIDYLGKIYNVYDIEGGYHHDVIVLDNGNYLLGSSNINGGTLADYLIEIDPETGKMVNNWDLKLIMNKISNGFVESLDNDMWADINSIYYDKNTDSLILSLEGRNSIVSIDYKSKEVNWIFGDIKYWNSHFSDYLVTIDSGEYPMGANTVSINSEGNLVLFNNNMDNSVEIDSPCSPYINAHSSGDIYKIEGKKATLVSSFNDNNSFFSYAVSNYYELANGNYLLYSAWQFKEGSLTNDASCTLNQINEGLSATIYETDKNNNILFKATLPFGSNRAKKLSLYQTKNSNFTVQDINYYNTLDATIYEEIDTNTIVDNLKNASTDEFSIEITKNLITINSVFQTNDEVYILLVGKEGKTYKYLSKSKDSYLQPIVNLRNIEGTYALFLVINDEYYNLDTVYDL